MLTLATAASAFMVSPAGLRVAQPAVNSPVMAMPGGVTGAVIGGAAVYAVDKLILNKESPKFNEDGSLAPVTKDDVTKAQKLWADSIASISKVYLDGGDFVGAAGDAAGKLYGYGKGAVLFKPTKATNNPFRATPESAMSYFVGAKAMENPKYEGEDAGFAINGGSGWKSVTFNNHQIELYGAVAHAMGRLRLHGRDDWRQGPR